MFYLLNIFKVNVIFQIYLNLASTNSLKKQATWTIMKTKMGPKHLFLFQPFSHYSRVISIDHSVAEKPLPVLSALVSL